MSDSNTEPETPKSEEQIYHDLVGVFLLRLQGAKTDAERETAARDIFNAGAKTVAATVGHELGNQLNPANGYLEILLGRKDLTEEQKIELLKESFESVHGAAELIQQFARIQTAELREYGNVVLVKVDRPVNVEDDGL